MSHTVKAIHNDHPMVIDATEDSKESNKPEPAPVLQLPNRSEPSVATRLVELAREHYSLGMTETDEAFGASKSRPHIAMPLRGGRTGLRAELVRRYFEGTHTAASQQAIADALAILEGYAAREAPQRVNRRVGQHGATIYIDMGDIDANVIRIHGGAWSVATSAFPVLFRRSRLTGPMPRPFGGGDVAKLWDFVPIDEDDRPLLLAWLVSALVQVDVPHTILFLLAEQGSAKSSITRCLVDLVDPSSAPLRQPPRDMEAWSTSAMASWVVALDNLSGRLPDWLADALCRASTGDGYIRRALYTDSDVAVSAFRRCCIINGIDLIVERGGLAQRLLPIDVRRIAKPIPETELASAWHSVKPEILGALLDLAAKVHHRLPTIEVDDLPRMADFAKVLACVDEVLRTNGVRRYRQRSQQVVVDTLDEPFIAALIAKNATFEQNTSAEILTELQPNDKDWKPPREWPRNARAVTAQLTRHAPALRLKGWYVEDDQGRNHDKSIRWTIRPPAARGESLEGRPASPANPQDDETSSSEPTQSRR